MNLNVAEGVSNVAGGWDVIVVCGTTGANFSIADTSLVAASKAKTSPAALTAAATAT